MIQMGHVLIDAEGQVVSLDAGFCSMMHARPDAMIGRSVRDVTAPADRQECADAIDRLRRTHVPFTIVKRFVRDDGALIWVKNTVSIMEEDNGRALLMATIERMEDEEPIRNPAMLLDNARALIAGRKARATVCDPKLFSEPAWDAILEIYIAEAEGRAIDVDILAAQLGHAASVTGRWVKALLQYDVLEIELRDPAPDVPKAYRLTSTTHRRLESYLARIGGCYPEVGIDVAA